MEICGPVWLRGFQEVNMVRLSASRPGRLYPLVLIFTRGWVDPRAMVLSEGNMSLKNPVTVPGIDPGTVRLVAQRLNHYATIFRMYNVIIFFAVHVGHPPGVSYCLFLIRSIKRPAITKYWSRSRSFRFHNVCRLLYYMRLSLWLRCTRHTMYILLLAASFDYRIYLS